MVKIEKVKKNLNNMNFSQLYSAFKEDWDSSSDVRREGSLIRDWYKRLFKEDLPKVHWYLIQLKVCYFLQINAYEEEGKEIPSGMFKNYKAIMKFEYKKLSSGMRSIVEVYMKERK